MKIKTVAVAAAAVVLVAPAAWAFLWVLGGPNLALNSGFEKPEKGNGELPEAWGFFTSSRNTMHLSTEASRSGTQSLKIKPQNVTEAFMGLLERIPVRPSEKYEFSAYVLENKKEPVKGPFHGLLSIEWLDENGEEIQRVTGEPWMRRMSRMRWTRVTLTGKAPAGATHANFVINVYDSKANSTGSFFIDDVCIAAR